MPDATVTSPAPRKRRGLRIAVWAVGILLVLLVALYFYATSTTFVRSFVLPRVSSALNADVTVSDTSIRPFSGIVLKDLKVQPVNREPLLTAPEVRVSYPSLMTILRGTIKLDEIALVSPTINVVEDPDGRKNIDPILESEDTEPDSKPSEPGETTRVDIARITLNNGTLRSVKLYKDNRRDVTEISNLNLQIANVKNGETGKLEIRADLAITDDPPPPGTAGALQAKLDGNLSFSLGAELQPLAVQGKTVLNVTRAEGGLAELAELNVNLESDVTPQEIRQVALNFQRGRESLGQVRVSGPFDMENTEGRLAVEVRSIDRRVLNLAGAKAGVDFGPTTINSTNQIELAKAGAMITAIGRTDVSQLQLTRTNQTTPALDIRAEYNVSLDLTSESALLQTLNITGTQNRRPLLTAELTSPMNLAWGDVTNAVGDSALNVAVTDFNLADWNAFVGDVAPAGMLRAQAKLLSQQGGKQLTFEATSRIENLTAMVGTNQLAQLLLELQANGQAQDLNQFNLREYRVQLARQNQSMVLLNGSGTYDVESESADMNVTLQVALAPLLEAFPQPDVTATSGALELKGRVAQKEKSQTVTGQMALTDFNGQLGENVFRGFGVNADLDLLMTEELLEIRKAAGALTEAGQAGGRFDISGKYNLEQESAQFAARLADFNQNGLRPFLQPMLADKELVSVALNGTASAQYDPKAASAIKADVQLANLVVRDPQNQIPATPLEARIQLDTSLEKEIADLRQFQVTLSPTERAKNQLQITGKVDMSQTNTISGALKLTAAALDLTQYYDLFAGDTAAAATPTPGQAPAPTPAPAPAEPQTEPEPMDLPFRDFTMDATIGKLYLREVEITNLQARLNLNGSRFVAKPFELVLNGAPVNASADLDLGVPGYKYDLAFHAQHIPFAPLVNSFVPERKGQLGGTLSADASLRGAGMTDASLQKSLTGKFDVATTNLNLAISELRSPTLKAVVNVIAILPDLLRNPGANPAALIGKLIGGATTQRTGLMAELTESPIDIIVAHGAVGAGRVDLQRAFIQSPAFQTETRGTIDLAEVLTNSTLNLPLDISLRRSIAEKINFVPAGTPTNVAYVRLPQYVTLRGPMSDPKTDIHYGALAGTALEQIGGIPGVDQRTGDLLKGLGGILTGRPAPTNPPPATVTNAPATNPPAPMNQLLDQFLKPRRN